MDPRLTDVERLAYRAAEVAAMLGVSRRLLDRESSAGRFPRPDLYLGRVPLWKRDTIDRFLGRRLKDG